MDVGFEDEMFDLHAAPAETRNLARDLRCFAIDTALPTGIAAMSGADAVTARAFRDQVAFTLGTPGATAPAAP